MSVTVQHLNADSSFLLTFSPKAEPEKADLLSANGAYTVLIDPWLAGPSIVSARWFAVTVHTEPTAIQHISEIEEPDVVLVSQNKPDHCHKDTLLQLRSNGKTIVAAEPGAARAIRGWNHFDPNRVHALQKYNAKAKFGNTLRLRIPASGPDGEDGELNIAFIPARNYTTGLHNGFGITYTPPTRCKGLASVTTINLPRRARDMVNSITPPIPAMSSPRSPHATYSSNGPHSNSSSLLPSHHDQQSCRSTTALNSQPQSLPPVNRHEPLQMPNFQLDLGSETGIDTTDFGAHLLTPPLSPSSTKSQIFATPRFSDVSTCTTNTFQTSPPSTSYTNIALPSPSKPIGLPRSPSLRDLDLRYSRPPAILPARPKSLSVLYTPHGLPLSDIKPYVRTHLLSLPGALPLLLLLHSFGHVQNPLLLGGNIMRGADGGIEIAKALMARCWISAHDEDKEDTGFGTKWLKISMSSEMDLQRRLVQESQHECLVRNLGIGDAITLPGEDKRLKDRVRAKSFDALGAGVRIGVVDAITRLQGYA